MPRKSQEALMSVSGSVSATAQQELLTENLDTLELPKNIVARIAKSALSPEAQLSPDVILALLKGSTAFVTTLAGSAHEIAISKQHKSITSNDVFKALEALDLGDMVECIQPELQAFRERTKIERAAMNPWGVPKTLDGVSVPSIRIKPLRQQDESEAAQQWDAHLKLYSKKNKQTPSAPVVAKISGGDSMDVDSGASISVGPRSMGMSTSESASGGERIY